MAGHTSNTTAAQAAEALRAATSILLTTHAKPDGDALGSLIALGAALERMGKRVERWIIPPLSPSLRFLYEGSALHFRADASNPLPQEEPDRIVVLDTSSWPQLESLREWLQPRRERVIVVDHHVHGDDVGAMRMVDQTAAATCELVADLIQALGVAWDQRICAALYVGIATDTGWFRFSNTTARTHTLAARLLEAGVDHAALYRASEQAERAPKLALMARALASTELVAGGRAAVMVLRREDFKATGARAEETDRLVDLPQVVEEVKAVVLLVEHKPQLTKLSLRSKDGPGAVDVNTLAERFGGGGHARASGARVSAPLDEVRLRVIEAMEEACAPGDNQNPAAE